jgi:hypothetical protein
VLMAGQLKVKCLPGLVWPHLKIPVCNPGSHQRSLARNQILACSVKASRHSPWGLSACRHPRPPWRRSTAWTCGPHSKFYWGLWSWVWYHNHSYG